MSVTKTLDDGDLGDMAQAFKASVEFPLSTMVLAATLFFGVALQIFPMSMLDHDTDHFVWVVGDIDQLHVFFGNRCVFEHLVFDPVDQTVPEIAAE